jgi:hypothetical protein
MRKTIVGTIRAMSMTVIDMVSDRYIYLRTHAKVTHRGRANIHATLCATARWANAHILIYKQAIVVSTNICWPLIKPASEFTRELNSLSSTGMGRLASLPKQRDPFHRDPATQWHNPFVHSTSRNTINEIASKVKQATTFNTCINMPTRSNTECDIANRKYNGTCRCTDWDNFHLSHKKAELHMRMHN